MFVDKKLNQHFNQDHAHKFMLRLMHLCNIMSPADAVSCVPSAVLDDCKEYAQACMTAHLNRRAGTVYVANNLQHVQYLKIGRTSKPIEHRQRDLNSAGVLGQVKILYWVNCDDCVMAETLVHRRLKTCCVQKEFFHVDYDIAASMVVDAANQVNAWYASIACAIREIPSA